VIVQEILRTSDKFDVDTVAFEEVKLTLLFLHPRDTVSPELFGMAARAPFAVFSSMPGNRV